MGRFEESIVKKYHETYLIDDGSQSNKTKKDYILDAEPGLIVAFRLNFTSRGEKKLTKVISGKILKNIADDRMLEVEAKNGLKYGVPYTAVVWVKTGDRWPKGVYNEMKRGSRLANPESEFESLGELHYEDSDGE
jgi:hypothetical protein